jgi:stage IV sporulation protein FB
VLAEPERTPYDVRFRLFGFPVRVHPWFWLGSVLLGANTLDLGVQYLAVWVGVVFVSILIHELGHAVAFRLFGASADVVLYAFGGLAIPTHTIAGRGRRIVVSLAGPGAGFLLAAIVYATNQAAPWAVTRPFGQPWPVMPNERDFLYDTLMFVNVMWGIFNLLPVFPLDGGQVSRELCGIWFGRRGKRISLQISCVVAVALVVYSLACALDVRQGGQLIRELPEWLPLGTFYTAILFGLLAYTSYQLLQQRDWTDDHWADDRVPWER